MPLMISEVPTFRGRGAKDKTTDGAVGGGPGGAICALLHPQLPQHPPKLPAPEGSGH